MNGITTKEWCAEMKVTRRPVAYKPGDIVSWRTMFGEWMYGQVVEDRGATLIVNRTCPAGADGLEMDKDDVLLFESRRNGEARA